MCISKRECDLIIALVPLSSLLDHSANRMKTASFLLPGLLAVPATLSLGRTASVYSNQPAESDGLSQISSPTSSINDGDTEHVITSRIPSYSSNTEEDRFTLPLSRVSVEGSEPAPHQADGTECQLDCCVCSHNGDCRRITLPANGEISDVPTASLDISSGECMLCKERIPKLHDNCLDVGIPSKAASNQFAEYVVRTKGYVSQSTGMSKRKVIIAGTVGGLGGAGALGGALWLCVKRLRRQPSAANP